MNRPLRSCLFLLAASVPCLALAEDSKSKKPSAELVETACGQGLLLQRDDPAASDTSADDAPGGAFAGEPGLFGASDDGGDKDKKGGAKPKPAAPAKKPKTKLLRPRSEQDKKDCPQKFGEFYEKHGDQFSAVPAPANLDAAAIKGGIDRAFGVASGPAKKQLLSDIKGEDMSAKSAAVAKIFDGVKKLDDAAFGSVIAKNLQGLSAGKAGGVMAGDLGAQDDDAAGAAAKGAEAAKAEAAKEALDPKAPNDPRSARQREQFKAKTVPPSIGEIRPPAAFEPVPENVAPREPGPVRRFYNNFTAEVGDYFHGSPIANYEGERTILPNPTPIQIPPGSDQSVNVPLPEAPGIERRCAPGCYGTKKMIAVLVGMGKDYSDYFQGKRNMTVGGISKLGGGYFPPHVSHQKGIDADIVFAGGRSFDVYANSMVVAAVVRKLPDFKHINGQEYILVDQSKHAAIGWGLDQLVKQGNLTPEQAARGKSVLVHWPNHNDHFHVRILP